NELAGQLGGAQGAGAAGARPPAG
ncbi:MAG: hypothetical protein QOF60_1889, partial [Actinomycetota bacterium]|nr:hypothetical protein [Actinomycetota bacterium]